MTTALIDLGKDFSTLPFGRTKDDGEYNGEAFLETLLYPAFQSNAEQIEVNFDHIEMAVGSSFLESAFGGLRRKGIAKADISRRLKITCARSGIYQKQITMLIERADSLMGR
ncbi:MAG: STAS-like domain-containing protein [Aeromonas sp.]